MPTGLIVKSVKSKLSCKLARGVRRTRRKRHRVYELSRLCAYLVHSPAPLIALDDGNYSAYSKANLAYAESMNPKPSSEDSPKKRVLIVEDQTAIREMLATFVSNVPGFSVVGEAGDVDDALKLAEAINPDVVVLDWILPGGPGLDFLRAVRSDPPPYVLVFSANVTEQVVRDAFGSGARGVVEKTASFAEFTAALKSVADGQTYFGSRLLRGAQRIAAQPDRLEANATLTARESEVLRLLAEGLSSKEIASRLGLSIRTVENHRAHIVRRTGLRSIAQLTLHAVRLGLIEMPRPEAPPIPDCTEGAPQSSCADRVS